MKVGEKKVLKTRDWRTRSYRKTEKEEQENEKVFFERTKKRP